MPSIYSESHVWEPLQWVVNVRAEDGQAFGAIVGTRNGVPVLHLAGMPLHELEQLASELAPAIERGRELQRQATGTKPGEPTQ